MKTPIVAEAHCDAPCGVYDPASARIAAEAVQSMTKKMLAMACPDTSDGVAMAAYMNTMARYAAVKEEEAQWVFGSFCLFHEPSDDEDGL